MTKKEYMLKILDLAYEITQKGEHEVFVEYTAHVDRFEAQVYKALGSWGDGKENVYCGYFYTDEEDDSWERVAKQIIQYLETL